MCAGMVVFCSTALQVNAAAITLFNTGVDASGTPLPHNTVGDPHYSLISVPGGTTDTRVITSDGFFPVFPFGPYIADNSTSAWIGPSSDSDLNGPEGDYVYRATFDLTGFDPATAVITGGWSSDDGGLDILINGSSLGFATADTQFSIGFSFFSVTSGFVAGINTLDFVVNNSGSGHTALRVEMAGSALSVPEPETYAMLLMGLGLVGFMAQRRKTL